MQEIGSKSDLKEVFAAVDPVFDTGQGRDYTLMCEVGDAFFSYTVYDTVRNQMVVLKTYEIVDPDHDTLFLEQIEQCIRQDPVFGVSYHALKVVFSSHPSLLVPESLFSPEKAKALYTYAHSLKENQILSYNPWQVHQLVVLFPLEERLYNLFYQLHPSPRFYHAITAMLNRSLKSKTKLLCDVGGGHFELVLLLDGKLQFSVMQDFCAPEDILYQLLWLVQKHKLSFCDVSLSGVLSRELMTIINKRMPDVQVDSQLSDFTLSYLFSQYERHRYSNLYQVKDCE